MPAPVSSASAWLAARLVSCVPSVMSSRSSAAPSGVRLRTAPSTSTVEMNFSVSSGSSSPATRGMAMQVAVSSSARSGSPAAIPAHRLDITRSTMASASVRPLPEGAVLAGAVLAGALLAACLAGRCLASRCLAGRIAATRLGLLAHRVILRPPADKTRCPGVDGCLIALTSIRPGRKPRAGDQKLTARMTPTTACRRR